MTILNIVVVCDIMKTEVRELLIKEVNEMISENDCYNFLEKAIKAELKISTDNERYLIAKEGLDGMRHISPVKEYIDVLDGLLMHIYRKDLNEHELHSDDLFFNSFHTSDELVESIFINILEKDYGYKFTEYGEFIDEKKLIEKIEILEEENYRLNKKIDKLKRIIKEDKNDYFEYCS